MKSSRILGVSAAFVIVSISASANAVTREETLVRARSYAEHPWSATSTNLTASCSAAYKSVYIPGDFVGVAYNWGGYQTLMDFDSRIASGQAAGAQPSDGVLACTAGVDCSGFVSMMWKASHHTTSNMADICTSIDKSAMLPGDVFNKAGYHVAMFYAMQGSGEPSFYEAYGYNVNYDVFGGWSHVDGYSPLRYTSITDTPVDSPDGTAAKPIAISSFPYSDSRNTTNSPSSVFDGCSISTANESGPEYVYSATFSQPGTFTVGVSDDATTDIDVEVMTSLDAEACVARNDSSVSLTVGCGTYYVLADTFQSSAGAYTLTANFTPSGAACGSVAGPPKLAPKGALGDACAYPGHEDLPFCNENLGGDTCVYSSTDSYCSRPCSTDADCSGMPSGGCCRDLGSSEFYCVQGTDCSGSGPSVGKGDGGTSSSGGGTGGVAPSDGSGSENGDNGSTSSGDGSSGSSSSGCAVAHGDTSSDFAATLIGLGLVLTLRRRRSMRG